ncbi:endoribonuclease YbeY [Collibacillus ludicampi]|uniref:Endoribonuclease YbeY n=2 Tax=Collibacillus ludicampi TaxID=2771369 RepID=A0AAV4LAL3_9BACL|nr:endoribonuclease YbeY [Collibacillus ludicampi]
MDVSVEVIQEVEMDLPVDVDDLLTKAIMAAASYEGCETVDVAVTIVDDETIRELNRTYRNKDASTDVLSFAMNESIEDEPDIVYDDLEDEIEEQPLGDIVISLPTAIRQAEEYGHSLERELAFLAIHGFLHLLGYDHMNEEDEKEMFSRQRAILEQIGLTRG